MGYNAVAIQHNDKEVVSWLSELRQNLTAPAT